MKLFWTGVLGAFVALGGLALSAEAAPGDTVGHIKLAVSVAPPTARCLVLSYRRNSGANLQKKVPLTPGQTTTVLLNALQPGRYTVQERVFEVDCAASGSGPATWISDPGVVQVEPHVTSTLKLNLRLRAVTTGELSVHTTFPGPTNAIVEYAAGTNNWYITGGPDGNLWFTSRNESRIGRATPDGTTTFFNLPSGSSPTCIAAGEDGNLWATSTNHIIRITTSGVFHFFTIPTSSSRPEGITLGPDGNMWFAETGGNKIGRITPSGAITEFALPTANSEPLHITPGPDGHLWFSEQAGHRIGKMTPGGALTEFALLPGSTRPGGITSGPDGNVWFVISGGKKLARITPSGVITEFVIPESPFAALRVTSGPDQNLWLTSGAESGSYVIRATLAGVFTLFRLSSGGVVRGITTGSDGALWFNRYSTVGSIRP